MSKYDTGSVVPRFHSKEQREKLAFMVILEESDLDGSPQLIVRPAKKRLEKAKDDLEENDAKSFVENFRKENEYMDLIRAILKILGKE